ncbi:MAG: hypothetical protein Q9163_005107 [Psora crenata]
MLSTAFYLLALVALGKAQATATTSLYFPDGPQTLTALTQEQDASATTYVITCPEDAATSTSMVERRQVSATPSTASAAMNTGESDEDNYDDEDDDDGSDNAGLENYGVCDSPMTIAQGPSTYKFEYALDGSAATLDCRLDGTSDASCAMTIISGDDDDQKGTFISTFMRPYPIFPMVPVTITAGAETTNGASATTRGSMPNATATNSPGASRISSGGSTSGAGNSSATRTSSGSGGSTSSTGNSSAPSSGSGSGGIHVEPALGMIMAGGLALGIAAVML